MVESFEGTGYRSGQVAGDELEILKQVVVKVNHHFLPWRGEIALGLIQVYRALGGGWQIRRYLLGSSASWAAARLSNDPITLLSIKSSRSKPLYILFKLSDMNPPFNLAIDTFNLDFRFG